MERTPDGDADDSPKEDIEELERTFKQEFGIDVTRHCLEAFLHGNGVGQARRRIAELREYAAWAYKVLLLRAPESLDTIGRCVALGSEVRIRSAILGSVEYRKLPRQFLIEEYPTGSVLFEHVQRTGGTAVVEAIRSAYPDAMGPDLDVALCGDLNEATVRGLSRFAFVGGHLGLPNRRRLMRHGARCLVTVLRDPVQFVRSIYLYWRSNIPPEHVAYGAERVSLARSLDFSSFIRHPTVRESVSNWQFAFLSGLNLAHQPQDGELMRQIADRTLDEFDYVGRTENVRSTVATILHLLDRDREWNVDALLKAEHSNVALGSVAIGAEDQAYLRSMNPVDEYMYSSAKSRFPDRNDKASGR